MVYKRFNIFIIIQVILIAVTCLLFFWSLNKSHLYIARFTFAGFVIVQVIVLISYIQKANKSLYRFMELLKSQQLMERFDQKDKEVSSQKLNQIYNEILDILSDVKVEKETEKQYFHHIFKTIGTAIISYKSNGEIDLINNTALKVLKCERINHINDFKSIYPSFYQFLIDLKNNENQLFKLLVGDEIIVLSVYCSVIKIKNDEIKTLSFKT